LNVLIKHKVEDYETWKKAFDNFASFRESSGEKSYRIFHEAGAENDLVLLFEWDTPANAKTFLASA